MRTMSDLIDRLRRIQPRDSGYAELGALAADEIELLRAELAVGDETVERGAQALFAAGAVTGNTHGNWDELGEDGRTAMRHLAAAVIRSLQLRAAGNSR
jgi:hypothetical protein